MKKFLYIFLTVAILIHFVPQISKAYGDSTQGTLIYPAISDYNVIPGEEKQFSKFIENNSEFDRTILIENTVIKFSKEFRNNPQLYTESVKQIEVITDKENLIISPNQKVEVEITVKATSDIDEGLYVLKTEFKTDPGETPEISINENIGIFTFITISQNPTSLKSISMKKFDFGKTYKIDFSLPWQNKTTQFEGVTDLTNNGKTLTTPSGYVTMKRNDLKLDSIYTINTRVTTLYPEDSISEQVKLTTSPYKTLRMFDVFSVYSYLYQDNSDTSTYEFREQKIYVINFYNIVIYVAITVLLFLTIELTRRIIKSKEISKKRPIKGKTK